MWHGFPVINKKHSLILLGLSVCLALTSDISQAFSFNIGATLQGESGSGQVAAYGFSEGAGTTTADKSGHGNTASLDTGAVGWTASGHTGNGVIFSGSTAGSSVTAPHSSYHSVSQFTMMAWIYPTIDTNQEQVVFAKNDTVMEACYGMWINDYIDLSSTGKPVASIRIGGVWHSIEGTSKISLNVWTHVAMVYDGAKLYFFRNGVLEASGNVTGTLDTCLGTLTIGWDAWGAYDAFNAGRIDDFRLYNRPMGATQINTIKNIPVH